VDRYISSIIVMEKISDKIIHRSQVSELVPDTNKLVSRMEDIATAVLHEILWIQNGVDQLRPGG